MAVEETNEEKQITLPKFDDEVQWAHIRTLAVNNEKARKMLEMRAALEQQSRLAAATNAIAAELTLSQNPNARNNRKYQTGNF